MAKTSAKAIEREMRLSRLLAKRVTGLSLRQIGQEESPPISLQAVAQLIGRAVSEMVAEPLEEVRRLELFRLDRLLAAVWEGAMGGDIACVDRCLAIMTRRSRLLGLDRQPNAYGREETDGEQVVRVEIVGNPEIARVRWLEAERERLLALTEGSAPPSTTLNSPSALQLWSPAELATPAAVCRSLQTPQGHLAGS